MNSGTRLAVTLVLLIQFFLLSSLFAQDKTQPAPPAKVQGKTEGCTVLARPVLPKEDWLCARAGLCKPPPRSKPREKLSLPRSFSQGMA